ncbi:ABC transporter substrate-binding protein [Sphaerochaeta sp. PS]|uniref:ABC transporter substrate-binding protein n=1 Tax=Sphaerochaeta sp. PS TaxID=3076336 RepID=UPI0028A3EC8F|nr:ABC transporter substrate-binding protein [Sphaerochaeta sp. PS]MDT4762052.1 ABC transporter substrate-binding protein [Sphaerochaeta sp. PS]
MYKKILITLLFSLLLLFSSCQKASKEAATQSKLPTLTVGMMSAVDAAPFYVALKKGYFREAGVDVRLMLFTNAQNRQTALQTGQVDGAMTDLVALITQTASDFKLIGTLSTDGDFPLLAKPGLEGKKAISVGTMEISVTNYLVDHYLGNDHTLSKVFINEIPARLEAVVSDQLDAGIFPEPFASIGSLRGLDKLFFEGIPSESLNLIAFTEKAVAEKYDALKKFHAAYAKAVVDIRQNQELALDALMENIPNLPEEIRSTIHLPQYHEPRLPSSHFMEEIMTWTESVTGTTYTFSPTSMIDPRFLEGL